MRKEPCEECNETGLQDDGACPWCMGRGFNFEEVFYCEKCHYTYTTNFSGGISEDLINVIDAEMIEITVPCEGNCGSSTVLTCKILKKELR